MDDSTTSKQTLLREIQELRKGEERFRSLVEATSDLIFEIDRHGVYTYVNPRLKSLLGYDPEEFIGRNIVDFMTPDHAQRVESILRENKGEPITALEIVRYHKDGQLVVFESSAVPIRDADGKCIGYWGISRDITARKRAEEQLAKEHKVLTRLLTEHDRERQMISYEIHDGLAQNLAGAIMHFQAFCGQLDHLSDAASSARDHIQQLLDQSLAEARRLIRGVRPPVLDDSGVLAAIQDLIDGYNNQEGPACEFECDATFERLDPVLEVTVYRVAQEGLANACRHSQSERVHLRISQRDKFMRIEVRDWGVGFDPEQVDEKQFGLLGMRERANLLGGSAEIRAEPGEGTHVIVELPLKLD
ncbi:MAG: PAS domain S-box protein [Pirellulaceae bacterium]